MSEWFIIFINIFVIIIDMNVYSFVLIFMCICIYICMFVCRSEHGGVGGETSECGSSARLLEASSTLQQTHPAGAEDCHSLQQRSQGHGSGQTQGREQERESLGVCQEQCAYTYTCTYACTQDISTTSTGD